MSDHEYHRYVRELLRDLALAYIGIAITIVLAVLLAKHI